MDAEVRWRSKRKAIDQISDVWIKFLVILLVLDHRGSAHKGENGRQCSHRHPRDDEVGRILLTIDSLTLILEINPDRCRQEIQHWSR